MGTNTLSLLRAVIFLHIFLPQSKAGILGNGELRPIQEKLIEKYHPEPILDTIREEEKYGNTETHPIGRAVVSVLGVANNKVVAALNAPGQIKNRTLAAIIAKLDEVGGRLVGLQKRR